MIEHPIRHAPALYEISRSRRTVIASDISSAFVGYIVMVPSLADSMLRFWAVTLAESCFDVPSMRQLEGMWPVMIMRLGINSPGI